MFDFFTEKEFFGNSLLDYVISVAILVLAVILGRFMIWLGNEKIRKRVEKTPAAWDDVLYIVFQLPFVCGMVLLVLWIAIIRLDYPDKIEIMFLDVCKTPEINFRIQQLFSRMIPGKSVLIQQDYIYENLPYIKITMGYLRDYFEYIGSIGCSVVFLLKKEIPMNILNINPCKIYPKES